MKLYNGNEEQLRVIDAAQLVGIGISRFRSLIRSGAPIPGLCQEVATGQFRVSLSGAKELQKMLRWERAKASVR